MDVLTPSQTLTGITHMAVSGSHRHDGMKPCRNICLSLEKHLDPARFSDKLPCKETHVGSAEACLQAIWILSKPREGRSLPRIFWNTIRAEATRRSELIQKNQTLLPCCKRGQIRRGEWNTIALVYNAWSQSTKKQETGKMHLGSRNQCQRRHRHLFHLLPE